MGLLWRHAGLKDPSEDDEGAILKLCTCESITRELTTPGGETAQMEAFAVWGEADASGCSVVLIAGDPDDYAAELEELLERKYETSSEVTSHGRQKFCACFVTWRMRNHS